MSDRNSDFSVEVNVLVKKTTLSNCKPEYDVDIELLTTPSVRCFFTSGVDQVTKDIDQVTKDIDQVTKDIDQATKGHKKGSLQSWFQIYIAHVKIKESPCFLGSR